VGKTAVPELASDGEAGIDDGVVHIDVSADLCGAVEELGHQQVLPLRRDLDEAERAGRGDAGAVHQPEEVVLVLHEAANRGEGRLVLEPPVDQGAEQLVPAVRTQMVLGVELAEQFRFAVAPG